MPLGAHATANWEHSKTWKWGQTGRSRQNDLYIARIYTIEVSMVPITDFMQVRKIV